MDLKDESQATLDMYGVADPKTEDFGKRCLLARRLVERGVRFIQLYPEAPTMMTNGMHTEIWNETTTTCRCYRQTYRRVAKRS